MNFRKQVLFSLVTLSCLSSLASCAYREKLWTWPSDTIRQNVFRFDNNFMLEAEMRTNYTAGPGPLDVVEEKKFDYSYHYELFALHFEAFA